MKTKIIYISGNEVFNMADIRAAFEEVRNTLGLDRDTIMFGVPVDNDDALALNQPCESVAEPEIMDSVEVDGADAVSEMPENVAVMADVVPDSDDAAAVTETVELSDQDSHDMSDEKIIPILSVLGGKSDDANDNAPEESVVDVSSTDIDITADFSGEKSDADDERSEIVDMITEDAPEKSVEKTLEQLLETMTPLREDLSDEMLNDSDVEIPDDALDTPDAMPDDELLSDSDATLEQLANEFAENQDKIPEPDKPETHSKIGKLKNILPFKKVKRDDTGLMGDLFGWAGVAANDDDFSMPGFFTKTASKK